MTKPRTPIQKLLTKLNIATAIVATGLLLVSGCSASAEQQLADARAQVAQKDYRTAVITLKNLLQKDPDSIEGRLLLAKSSFALGDPAAAEKDIERARDLGASTRDFMPLYLEVQLALRNFTGVLEVLADDTAVEGIDPVDALRYRGEALLALGSGIEAEKTFREASEVDPDNPEIAWGLASSLLATGRAEEAHDTLNNLTESHPDFARGWLLQGQVDFRNGELAPAEAHFAKAADLAPAIPDRMIEIFAVSGTAEAQLAQRKLDAADETIQRLRALTGPAPFTRLLTARLASARSDFELAESELEEVVKAAPDNLSAAVLYGSVLISQRKFAQAEVVLSQLVARSPDNPMARRLLATAQMELSEHSAAIETIGPFLETGNAGPEIAMLASRAMLQSGSVDNAIELLEKSLAAEPDNDALKLSLAKAYLQAQRAEDAIALTQTVADDEASFYKELYLALGYAATNQGSEADARIASITERFSDNPNVMVLIGDFNIQRNDVEQAGDYYQRAIDLDSSNSLARLGLGRIAASSGDTTAAADYFESVLADEPENAAALISLANLKAMDDDLEGSEQLLLQVLETGDRSPLPRLMLARIYQQQGDSIRAEQSAQEAARLGEGNATVQLDVGDILMSIGEPRAALAYLNAATKLAPMLSTAWYSLARAQLSLDQAVDARASLDRSLEIDPDGLRASVTLALIELGDGNTDRALQIASRLRETYPDNPGPINLAASIHMSQGKFADAAGLYRKAYSLSPSGALARSSYQAAQSAGFENAEKELELWVAQSPDDFGSKLILAQHYTSSGAEDKSVALYEEVVAVDDNVIALNNLAWTYMQLGDDRAESLARRAYELRPDVASVADTLGWILVKKGNLAEGLPLIEEAAAKSPDNASIRYHLAFAKNESGARSESLQILRELLQTEANFSERADAESLLNRLEAE